MPAAPRVYTISMLKAALLPALLLVPYALPAFELPALRAPALLQAEPAAPPAPALPPAQRAAACYAVYAVDGVEVAVPHIGCGRQLLAALRPGDNFQTLTGRLRAAFGAPPSAAPAPLQPSARAEVEFAAANPGARLFSVNAFLPANVRELFNRDPNFGGPNCFNAAFTAAGLMDPARLRHVGNHEADQLLAMYFKKVPAGALKPGDVLVLNDGDHGAYYLGGGLVFHKKSYLKQHSYRIARLEKVYYPEPFEWRPGPFDSGSPFNDSDEVKRTEAWRPTGASYEFGQASADEAAKVEAIIFLTESIEKQAPRWAFSKELGYFTERLLENLVSDWGALGRGGNPVLKAYYHRLESLRDQANQSVETELLSSPHAQGNADKILREYWLPRNAYSRDLAARLLKIYGKDPALAEAALDAVAAKFDGSPLQQIKSAGTRAAAAPEAVAYTSRQAARLAALAGKLTQVGFTDGGMDGQDKYYYQGAPAQVRRVRPAETGIMRHWTSNAQADGKPVVDLIVQSGVLKAGPRPYIVPESHRADYYQDLHGVFFTTPDFPAGQLWMGLTPDTDYVDFTVDPGMGALYLAPGNYLFPCPLKLPEWLAKEYRKWKAGGPLPAGMEMTFDQVDREGGLRDPLDIPVTVVRYQKNGKVTVLRPDLLAKPY